MFDQKFQFFEKLLKTPLTYPEIFFGPLRTVWSLRKSDLKFFCDLRLTTILRNLKICKNSQKMCQKSQKSEACPPP